VAERKNSQIDRSTMARSHYEALRCFAIIRAADIASWELKHGFCVEYR